MQKEQSAHLQYDDTIDPHSKLQIHNYSPKYQLSQIKFIKLSNDGLVIRYDPQNEYIGVGCRNGDRIIYDIASNKVVEKYNCANQNPVTTLKWRPMGNSSFKTLVTADSDGNLEYWYIPELKKLFSTKEQHNTINTIDFNRSGSLLATGGKDCNIRIYQQQTKSISVICKKADWNNIGHDNRVFAVKFIDDNILISGGWDSVIHVWDIRQGKSIRHFYGSNISGESLDFQDGKVLAGCYAAKDQIQIWDFNTGSKVECIDWTEDIDVAAYVYAAGYSRYDIGSLGAGSTGGENSVRIYKEMKEKGKHSLLCELKGVNQGCFSFDFSVKSFEFSFSTTNHGFYRYNLVKK